MRQNISGTSPFEPIIGFSRAVRVGNIVHVSGTGPVGADKADAATQTRHTLEIIRAALEKAGARMEDVVRTRMYLTHVEDWEAVGRVHGEYLRHRSVPRRPWSSSPNYSIQHGASK